MRGEIGVSSRGLSLAEVIIAIGLLAVAIVSLVAMFSRGMIQLGHSKQVSQATDAAQTCLETIKAGGPGFVALGTFDGRQDDPANADGFPPAPYPKTAEGYPLVVRASQTGTPAGTVAVSVEVFYESGQKVYLETYLGL